MFNVKLVRPNLLLLKLELICLLFGLYSKQNWPITIYNIVDQYLYIKLGYVVD